MKILALSGWGQAHDALKNIAPEATHIDYAMHDNAKHALQEIADTRGGYELIIGWSQGGQLAAEAIAKGYIATQRLILLATPFRFVKNSALSIGMPQLAYEKFRENYARNPLRALAKAWELVAMDDKHAAKIRIHMEHIDKAPLIKKHWNYWFERLGTFSCADIDLRALPPTTLIHGRQDAVVWHEQLQHFAKHIPQARLISWDECGHAPHWHNETELRKIIYDAV